MFITHSSKSINSLFWTVRMNNINLIIAILFLLLLSYFNRSYAWEKPKWVENAQKGAQKAVDKTVDTLQDLRGSSDVTFVEDKSGRNKPATPQQNRPSINLPSLPNVTRPPFPTKAPSVSLPRPKPLPTKTQSQINREIQIINDRYQTMKRNTSRDAEQLYDRFNQKIDAISNQAIKERQAIQDKTKRRFGELSGKLDAGQQALERIIQSNPIDIEGLNNVAANAKEAEIKTGTMSFDSSDNESEFNPNMDALVDLVNDIESSQVAKELHDWGTKASSENIEKGVSNTIEYWTNLNADNKTRQGIDDLNEYIDIRARSTDKKVNAALEAKSFPDWMVGKVMGGDASVHKRKLEERERKKYFDKHRCDRLLAYQKLNYTKQQAAILDYLIYGNECKNISDLNVVNSYLSYFDLEFKKEFISIRKQGNYIDEEALTNLFKKVFFISLYSYRIQSPQDTLNLTDSLDDGPTEAQHYWGDDGNYHIDFSESPSEIKPNTPSPTTSHENFDSDNFNHAGATNGLETTNPNQSPSFSLSRENSIAFSEGSENLKKQIWLNDTVKELKRSISNINATFSKSFITPLVKDIKWIYKSHNKEIDNFNSVVSKVFEDLAKDEIEDLFKKQVFKGLKGIGFAFQAHSVIMKTFEVYKEKTFEYVLKIDPKAKQVPVGFNGSAGIGDAALVAQQGKTAWKFGGFWYYHNDINYKPKTQGSIILRGNSVVEHGTDQLDIRDSNFLIDVLQTTLDESLGDYLTGKLRERFKNMVIKG